MAIFGYQRKDHPSKGIKRINHLMSKTLQVILGGTMAYGFAYNPVSAVTATDLYSELDFKGELLVGSQLQNDKAIIRPAYMGSWESMKVDVVGEDGKAFFSKLNTVRTYKRGESIYYNNVGFYQMRQTALKITFFGSPYESLNGIMLNNDGSLTQGTSAVDSRGASLQLVYSDTKEPVEGVYTEMPVEIFAYAGYNGPNKTWTEVKFSQAGLKKIYLKIPSLKETSTQVSLANWSDSKQPFLGIRPSSPYFSTHLTLQNYIAVFDNQFPLQLGAEIGFAYRPDYHYFRSAVESPRVPDYSAPLIEGKKNQDQFSADFVINQSLIATYDQFYPTNLTIILEDEGTILSKIDPKTVSVRNRVGKDITDQCDIINLADNDLRIRLSKQLLKELKGEGIQIFVSYKDLDVETVAPFYVAESQSYQLPLSAYTVRENQGEVATSSTSSGIAEIIPSIYAEPVPQSIILGGSTAELTAHEMIKGQRSTIPDDDILVEGFEKELLFNQVGASEARVVLGSRRQPLLKRSITVPVIVRNQPVGNDYFDDQTWLIDEINRQLHPKIIGKNLYESDLRAILTISVGENSRYTGQFIPKRIDSLQGLKELSYTGNSISKGIPEELGTIKSLEKLDLSHSELTGTIPDNLKNLEALQSLKLNNNHLVNQVPKLDQQSLSILDISYNELTINSQEVPLFLQDKGYSQTFIGDNQPLTMTATNYLAVAANQRTIRPFDNRDGGYFGLAIKNSLSEETTDLLDTHSYCITDERTGERLYEGKWDSSVSIPYDLRSVYRVILDGAEKNPNNVVVIKAVLPELKLTSIPERMTMKLSIGNFDRQAIKLDGELTIYDNRLKGNWQLGIKATDLKSKDHTLRGQFYYVTAEGQTIELLWNQKTTIESGEASLENPTTGVGTSWTEKRGLTYQLSGNNFRGNYSGEIMWSLEDVPTVGKPVGTQ
ncbi:hypothetical protein [uncultured Vagococcus sp.]|uniref:hypothetical protein n=1 Tax=uncultured Vagococcus sp. TaxID=189676 RepID=UPI0028D48FF4|nr:hypothetical protein [uncultured Vagococcus sp.]